MVAIRRLRTFASLAVAIALVWLSGLSFAPILTDSMVPYAYPADVVVAVSPRLVKPEVGRVAIFETVFGEQELPPIAHRLVAKTPKGWRTKGDNAENVDGWFVADAQIKKVVIASLPFRIFKYPPLIGIIVALAVGYFLWPDADSDDEDELAGEDRKPGPDIWP